MTALAGISRKGGLLFRQVPDVIELLARSEQFLATVVIKCIQRFQVNGELATMPTDEDFARESARMAQESGIEGNRGVSPRSIQKGLHAVEVELGKLGVPLIRRTSGIGMHGRRRIEVLPLAGQESSAEASADPPPGPPPEYRREIRETTTDGRSSSSSLRITPPTPEGTGELAPAELIARACKLVPKATPGRVIDAASVYGAEWVSRALDRVEERNRKPGNKEVRSWGFVLNTLANWRKEGGPPPDDPGPTPAAQARPAVGAAEEEPPRRLTAVELAELVARCQGDAGPLARIARVTLRNSVADGSVPSDLVATIPAELLEVTPRAP